MFMKYYYKLSNEKGELLVLFSVILVVLILIIGMLIDFSMYVNERTRSKDIARIIKDTKYDFSEALFNSDRPEEDLESLAKNIAIKNGMDPAKVQTEWIEDFYTNSEPNGVFIERKREAIVKIEISDKYETLFLKMFNFEEIPINISLESKMEKDNEFGYIWSPGNR